MDNPNQEFPHSDLESSNKLLSKEDGKLSSDEADNMGSNVNQLNSGDLFYKLLGKMIKSLSFTASTANLSHPPSSLGLESLFSHRDLSVRLRFLSPMPF